MVSRAPEMPADLKINDMEKLSPFVQCPIILAAVTAHVVAPGI
jgi:hypothetical protein